MQCDIELSRENLISLYQTAVMLRYPNTFGYQQ